MSLKSRSNLTFFSLAWARKKTVTTSASPLGLALKYRIWILACPW